MASSLTSTRLERALSAQIDRVDKTLTALDGSFPFVADPDTGEWETTEDGDWTAGHWIGLLWLASEHASTSEERNRFARAARVYTRMHLQQGDLEWMFAGMSLYHAGFQSYDISGDRIAYGIGFMGADSMLALFDEHARQIPVGDIQIEGPEDEFEFREDAGNEQLSGTKVAAVDNVYATLPVLWRAYRETKDPCFRDVAVSHTDRHLDLFLRDNGSTWNLAKFDLGTGDVQHQFNVLAHASDTCWARGHAWNIAGLAHAYAETSADRYRDALSSSVKYYREHAPKDLVPYWDFEAPSIPNTVRDTSAAAITANGLLQLPSGEDTEEFRSFGKRILESIVDEYLVLDEASNQYGMILEGCYNYPSDYATENELIWTDYYVAQLLWTLLKEEK